VRTNSNNALVKDMAAKRTIFGISINYVCAYCGDGARKRVKDMAAKRTIFGIGINCVCAYCG